MDDEELKLCGEVGKDARAFVRKYMQLRAYADELDACCVADAADAERYRWLRNQSGTLRVGPANTPDCYFTIAGEFNPLKGFLDDAIDAAMAADAAGAA